MAGVGEMVLEIMREEMPLFSREPVLAKHLDLISAWEFLSIKWRPTIWRKKPDYHPSNFPVMECGSQVAVTRVTRVPTSITSRGALRHSQ